jgi:ribose transport system ATP-binding protein
VGKGHQLIDPEMTESAPVLRLSGVVKTFPGVVALKGVSLDVTGGEVHALVGENGAGKSTLMAVAAGAMLPDEGTVEIGGRPMLQPSPAAAQAAGLAVVYQHTSILEDLTVAENMVLGMPPGRRPSMARVGRWTRERLATVGAAIDPETRVADLTPAERQLVEIAKALALDAQVLVLDEPTESLNAAESEILFERIRAITTRGAAVVYISHRLPEVKRIADRITVLRDGETRGTFQTADVSTDDILSLIVGRSMSQVFPTKRDPTAPLEDPVLDVRGLTGARFTDIDLTVAPGEIVGLAGVEGNGQREFLRALAGLGSTRGKVIVDGAPVAATDPYRARRSGVVHLPGDRHRDGVFLSLSVRENIALLSLPRAARLGFVDRARELVMVRPEVERLAIRTPSLEAPISTLSGGNQQKALIARSILSRPRVLLADEPTRGVDAGARIELYRILREAAADGKAVVVASSDAIELGGLCDRVLVFSRGRVVATLSGESISESDITVAAITATGLREGSATRRTTQAEARRFASGDYAPSTVLAVLAAALIIFTSLQNPAFLSTQSLSTMLLLASGLIFASIGQLTVVLVGGLDLSVGAVIGVVVIAISTFIQAGGTVGGVVIGLGVAVGIGLAVGLANGLLVRIARLAPVLATLATSIVLEGISLLLRPQPSGAIDPGFIAAVKTTVGPIPVVFIGAVILVIAAEIALRRTGWGLGLRAVGSDAERAYRLGARVTQTNLVAYLLCATGAVFAGIVLAALVGIGQAQLGGSYTLSSITAVVLGGASIFGGRGSYIGAFVGAVLLQVVITSTSFLDFGRAWQFWLPGALILLAAAAYTRARRSAAAGGLAEGVS